MDAYQIFLLILTSIVIGISIFLTVRKFKKENWDTDQVLESILEQILDLCKSTLEILKTERDEYESEEAFRTRLANIVAKKVRNLLEQTGTSETLLKVLTEEVISEFIVNMFGMYSREIGLEQFELQYRMRKNSDIYQDDSDNNDNEKVDMVQYI